LGGYSVRCVEVDFVTATLSSGLHAGRHGTEARIGPRGRRNHVRAPPRLALPAQWPHRPRKTLAFLRTTFRPLILLGFLNASPDIFGGPVSGARTSFLSGLSALRAFLRHASEQYRASTRAVGAIRFVHPRAVGQQFVVTWGQGQVEARIVERRQRRLAARSLGGCRWRFARYVKANGHRFRPETVNSTTGNRA